VKGLNLSFEELKGFASSVRSVKVTGIKPFQEA